MMRAVTPLHELPIKIYADGADLTGIRALYADPLIQGLTTNPTLMRKAGIADYEKFARNVLAVVTNKPISFEVFADEFPEMRRQALKIRGWQENVFVKIPITNMKGESALPLVAELAREGVQVNVTAILTDEQVEGAAAALNPGIPAVLSLFCGRIADTGRDPTLAIQQALLAVRHLPSTELLWASVREVLNIYQASEAGAQIVTVQHDILAKAREMSGMALSRLSLETVQMFGRDAAAAGYRL